MSIIYDALKKLEGKGDNEPENHSQETTLEEDSTKPKKSRRPLSKKNILILGAFLLILVFSFTFGRQYIVQEVSSLLALVKKGDLFDPQKFLSLKSLLSSKTGSGSEEPEAYRLDGIIYDLDFPVAIINGSSFKKEDSIGEYRIVEITKSTVELINTKDETKLTISIEF